MDANQAAVSLDGGHLEMHHCTDPQASGIRGNQQSAVRGVFGAEEEALEFLGAQDMGQRQSPGARWQVEMENMK